MNERQRLPNERAGLTHRFVIKSVNPLTGEPLDVKGYITTGCYPDGRLGEIFVKMDQQGSQVSGFVDSWAIAVSLLLQMGMPVEEIVRKFRGCRFEPSGQTDNPDIRIAQSPVDYIARYLEGKYVDVGMFDDDDADDAAEETVAVSTNDDSEAEKCQKCGSIFEVLLHRGFRWCKDCRSGKPKRRAVPA